MEHLNTSKKICAGGLRISSMKQLEGDSLDDQKKIIEALARKINGEVKHWFPIVDSATGDDPEKQPFKEVIDYFKINKEYEYLLVSKLDRFTRGGLSTYDHLKDALVKYDVSLLDAEGIVGNEIVNTIAHLGLDKNYWWALNNPSRQREVQVVENAKEEGKVIVNRLISAEIRYVQNGYWMRKPPFGFKSISVDTGKGKRRLLVPEENKEADFIRLMFKLTQRGNLTDPEICDELNLRGYKSREFNKHSKIDRLKIIGKGGGIKLEPEQLRKYIRGHVYAGVICEVWTNNKPIKAQFEGLVSIEEFNDANKGRKHISCDEFGNMEIHKGPLSQWKAKRQKNNPDYAYKDYVLCSVCNEQLLGSASTSKSGKKHPAYHCSRGHSRFGIKKRIFDDAIKTFINSIELSDEFRKKFIEILREEWLKREKGFNSKALDVNTQILEIDKQTETCLESFNIATSEVMKKEIEKRVEQLQARKRFLANSRNKKEEDQLDMEEVIKHTKYYMEHLHELLTDNENPLINASFFGLLFEERPTYDDLVYGTPNLSGLFKLNEEFKVDESLLVTPRRIELRFLG